MNCKTVNKIREFNKGSFVFLITLLALLNTITKSYAGSLNNSTYQYTCNSSQVKLSQNTPITVAYLNANCYTVNGNLINTSVPILDIDNINGVLTNNGLNNSLSSFQFSCDSSSYSLSPNNVFSAKCAEPNGVQKESSISIPGIDNINGVLTLQNNFVYGSWVPTYLPIAQTDPPYATMALVFSGYADPDQALSNSSSTQQSLNVHQVQYITVGGGTTSAGYFTDTLLKKTITDINNGRFSAYKGIAFDIEYGDTGLTQDFQNAFNAAKKKNLKVLVTVGHSAPFINDANTMMAAFFKDSNIDYISPQLYTSGDERTIDTSITGGSNVQWSAYKNAKATIVPSISPYMDFNAARNFFSSNNIPTNGVIIFTPSN